MGTIAQLPALHCALSVSPTAMSTGSTLPRVPTGRACQPLSNWFEPTCRGSNTQFSVCRRSYRFPGKPGGAAGSLWRTIALRSDPTPWFSAYSCTIGWSGLVDVGCVGTAWRCDEAHTAVVSDAARAAESIAAARLSKSSGSWCAYTFIVVMGDWCPRSFCTVTTDAPDASANEPAVCRRV
jgi:hypothetical protein